MNCQKQHKHRPVFVAELFYKRTIWLLTIVFADKSKDFICAATCCISTQSFLFFQTPKDMCHSESLGIQWGKSHRCFSKFCLALKTVAFANSHCSAVSFYRFWASTCWITTEKWETNSNYWKGEKMRGSTWNLCGAESEGYTRPFNF